MTPLPQTGMVRPMRPPRLLHPILSRPSFAFAFLTLAAGLAVTPWGWHWSTRAVVSWDLAMIVFIALVFRLMGKTIDANTMAKQARRLDEGRGAVLVISLLGAVASLVAVILEIHSNKVDKGAFQSARIALMIATVALSWFFVQIVFALHYAHDWPSAGRLGAEVARQCHR